MLILFIRIVLWLKTILHAEGLASALKQQFTKHINGKRTYFFYNDQINLKNFDARLLKVDKKIQRDLLHRLCDC